jgi:hypothetical protein
MNFHRFNNMDEMEQLEAFWNGVYIGERSDGEFKIECRQVEDFYVEYKMIGGHYIDMRSFKSPDMLQPYLDQMGKLEI